MGVRVSVQDFSLANPIYKGATVTFYTVDVNGVKTTTKATLYAGPTGTTELTNPVTLGTDGKFQAAVYIEDPVVAAVSGLTTADHETGVIFPEGTWRGDWVTATLYYPGDVIQDGVNGPGTNDIYHVVSMHTSGVWATDAADATKLALMIDMSTLTSPVLLDDTTPQLGGTLDTNSKRIDFSEGAVIASGSSCDIWANSDGNTVHITGTTEIDDFATAPKAGAWMLVVFDGAVNVVDSATITVDGNTDFTTEAGDMALVYAETTTTFRFKPLPVDGGSPVAPVAAAGVSGDVQTFTVSGTWTKPTPAGTLAFIQVWGGGGSGGKSTSAAGGGGGGGGYDEKWVLVSALGATETVTIGAGGAAQPTTNNPGNVGGNTTLGAHLTGYGGGAGGGASDSRSGGGGGGGRTSVGATGTSAAEGLGGKGGTPGGLGGAAAAEPGVAGGGGGGGAGKTTGDGGSGGAGWAGGGGGGGCSGGGTTAGHGGDGNWGGGGGGGGNEAATGGTGGSSAYGGAGSDGTVSASSAAGTQPGGGSGGTGTGTTTGAGGDGKCVVTLF